MAKLVWMFSCFFFLVYADRRFSSVYGYHVCVLSYGVVWGVGQDPESGGSILFSCLNSYVEGSAAYQPLLGCHQHYCVSW